VIGFEPAVIGVASFIGSANSRGCFHVPTLGLREEFRKYHVSCLSITFSYTKTKCALSSKMFVG
jgi:hypothetical protein